MKGYAVTIGIGAALGAVAVFMLPRNSSARKLAQKTAGKAEAAASKISRKLEDELDCF